MILSLTACQGLDTASIPALTATPSIDTTQPITPTIIYPTSHLGSSPTPPLPRIAIRTITVDDFTFTTMLYRDPVYSTNPPAPWAYSDMEGIGVDITWEYHGSSLQEPILELYGVLPNLSPRTKIDDFTEMNRGGRKGGIVLPEGVKVGDRIEIVLALQTQETKQVYGSVISFTLKEEENGLVPIDIRIESWHPQLPIPNF